MFTYLHILCVYLQSFLQAKILLEEGAEVNFTNKQGLTALAVAAANNRNYMLSFLHRNGASINKPTNEGLTPLHIATSQNNDKMAGYIIDRDGDFNGKHHGRSPIDYVDNSWKFKRVNIENIGGPITKVNYKRHIYIIYCLGCAERNYS